MIEGYVSIKEIAEKWGHHTETSTGIVRYRKNKGSCSQIYEVYSYLGLI